MTPTDSRVPPHVMAVGDGDSGFVRAVARLAGDYGLAVIPCDDIYSAAAELARHPDRLLMVTGLFRELARAKGDFFALAQRRGVPCCCLLDEHSDIPRDKILTVVHRGVHLAGEMAGIRAFLEERLDAGKDRSPEAGEDVFGAPFRATQDEINALLGQDTDG